MHAHLCGLVLQVDVSFKITTCPGQEVVLVGSHQQLGCWRMDAAVALTWTDGHVWRASVELPAECSSFEYKVSTRLAVAAQYSTFMCAHTI